MTKENGNPHTLEVDLTDLYRTADALKNSLTFFKARDEMDAARRCASVGSSPLTRQVEKAYDQLQRILDGQRSSAGRGDS
jgi:hypothetical protein